MGLLLKILITGITGYVGSNLAVRCEKLGHHVIPFHRGDKFWKIREAKPDVIFHCAAEIYEKPKMFASNVELTYNLLEVAEVTQPKAFIYVGSSSEYGRNDNPMAETDRLNPQTMYEATKGCGSLLTLASNIPAIVARPFSVYGRNEPYRRFIPLIYRHYQSGELLTVGPGVHDFIFIDDFIGGLLFCMIGLLLGWTKKDIINFGTGTQYHNIEVIETFEKIVGQKLNWTFDASLRKEYDTYNWRCDTTHATSLGWRSETSLEKGLEMYIRYRQENHTPDTRN